MFHSKTFSLRPEAFSDQIFTFLPEDAHNDLAAIFEINLLENADPISRERWQQAQLNNLFDFATSQSNFWRKRIGTHRTLEKLSPLTREELARQVQAEGSLTPQYAQDKSNTYASSGSTGTPVQVHVCPQNGRYNELRSLSQYFLEGRSLNQNRTFIRPASAAHLTAPHQSLSVERFDTWLGSLSGTFQSGSYKIINFSHDIEALMTELLTEKVGYLACLGSHMDMILQYADKAMLERLGIHMWLHHSDNQEIARCKRLKDAGIPISSNYSCAELGPIAVECQKSPSYYHVAHSNVLVEIDSKNTIELQGQTLGRVLLTHLHAYATPLIRYDVGDYAALHSKCPCGHEGATLSDIYGRKKYFLKKENGELLPFLIFSKPLSEITTFKEFFIYQKDFHTIMVQLGGRFFLEEGEAERVTQYIQRLSNKDFRVHIELVDRINWSKNPKKLPFICAVA